jgi:hypothetical protein
LPEALVTTAPLPVPTPDTEKRTVPPGVGFPNWSTTCAITQCCVPSGFVSVAGVSVSVAGGPGMTVALMVCVARTVPSTTAVTVHV